MSTMHMGPIVRESAVVDDANETVSSREPPSIVVTGPCSTNTDDKTDANNNNTKNNNKTARAVVVPAVRAAQAHAASKFQATADRKRSAMIGAKRRAALTSSQQAKREWERTVFQKQQELFEGAVAAEILQDVCRFLTPTTYAEVIEERNVSERLCGYPLCGNANRTLRGKFRVSIRRQEVYDVDDLNRFCSATCNALSDYVSRQLPEDAVYIRDVDSMPLVHVLPASLTADELRALVASPKHFITTTIPSSSPLPEVVAAAATAAAAAAETPTPTTSTESKSHPVLPTSVAAQGVVRAYADDLLQSLPALVGHLTITER